MPSMGCSFVPLNDVRHFEWLPCMNAWEVFCSITYDFGGLVTFE